MSTYSEMPDGPGAAFWLAVIVTIVVSILLSIIF